MAALTFEAISDLKRQPVSGVRGFPQPMAAQMESDMPATSRKQFRFMKAVASGAVKKSGLSKSEAAEFTSGQSPKNLPAKAPKRRHKVSYPSPSRKGGK